MGKIREMDREKEFKKWIFVLRQSICWFLRREENQIEPATRPVGLIGVKLEAFPAMLPLIFHSRELCMKANSTSVRKEVSQIIVKSQLYLN